MFAGDDVKTNDLELYFWKVVRCKCFCKKLYFAYWDLFIRKVLLERYLLERIKSSLRHLQFMVGQKHNLVGHLVLPRIFPVGQNVRCVSRLVGQFLIFVGHCPMSDRYFKAWQGSYSEILVKIFEEDLWSCLFFSIFTSYKPVTWLNTNSATPCNFTKTRAETCNFTKKELLHR